MEVLACIPELPRSAAVTVVSVPPRSERVATVPVSPPEHQVPADDADDADAVSPALRRNPVGRSRPPRLFSPSIIALAAMAAVVWAAAWRNDQLRLEAARLQRPERLAQELPATAGGARSVKP